MIRLGIHYRSSFAFGRIFGVLKKIQGKKKVNFS